MSEGGEATDIARLDAPYRREVVFQDVVHESGMRMLRIQIREGRRFTILDIDKPTAQAWADILNAWAQDNGHGDGEGQADADADA